MFERRVSIKVGATSISLPVITWRPSAVVSLLLLFFLSLESLPLPIQAQIIPMTSLLALVFLPFTTMRIHITPLFKIVFLPFATMRIHITPLLKIVLLFATFVLLHSAIAISIDVIASGAGEVRVLAWARQVAALVAGLSVFFVLRRTLMNTSARFMIYAVIAGALPALAVALLNVVWGITGNQFAGSIVVGIRSALLPWGYNDPLRASGLSLEPAYFAFYLASVVIPVALVAFTTSKRRLRWLVFLASVFIAFAWTVSTTGFIVLLSLLLTGVLFGPRRALFAVLVAVVLVSVVGLVVFFPGNYAAWQIQNLLSGDWTTSISSRFYSTLGPFMNLFSSYTLLGYGLGGTSTHLSEIVPAIAQADIAASSWQDMPNLRTLTGRLLAETGLIGLTLAIFVIIIAWHQLRLVLRTPGGISERSLLESGRLALASLIVGYTISQGSFALPYLWFWLAVIDSRCLLRAQQLRGGD